MYCPICNREMTIVNKQGILVDFCPGCNGYWLDTNELYRMICGNPQSVAERVSDRRQKYKASFVYTYGRCPICQFHTLNPRAIRDKTVRQCPDCGMHIYASDLEHLLRTIKVSLFFRLIKPWLIRFNLLPNWF